MSDGEAVGVFCHDVFRVRSFVHRTVTRYLPKNPGSPLFMRDLGGQAGRGAPNQIGTST